VRPIKKSRKKTAYQARKKRKSAGKRKGKDILISGLIGLVLIANGVLIFYMVRHCAGPSTEMITEEPAEPEPPVYRQLQIEVLNGCGVSGVANRFTDFLRSKTFDVVKTDNYEEEPGRANFNVIETVVIDRRGKKNNAMRVIKALGIGESRLLEEVNEAYLIDATVIIGKDYRTVPAWNQMEN
jgi:hypothetical protein